MLWCMLHGTRLAAAPLLTERRYAVERIKAVTAMASALIDEKDPSVKPIYLMQPLPTKGW